MGLDLKGLQWKREDKKRIGFYNFVESIREIDWDAWVISHSFLIWIFHLCFCLNVWVCVMSNFTYNLLRIYFDFREAAPTHFLYFPCGKCLWWTWKPAWKNRLSLLFLAVSSHDNCKSVTTEAHPQGHTTHPTSHIHKLTKQHFYLLFRSLLSTSFSMNLMMFWLIFFMK